MLTWSVSLTIADEVISRCLQNIAESSWRRTNYINKVVVKRRASAAACGTELTINRNWQGSCNPRGKLIFIPNYIAMPLSREFNVASVNFDRHVRVPCRNNSELCTLRSPNLGWSTATCTMGERSGSENSLLLKPPLPARLYFANFQVCNTT